MAARTGPGAHLVPMPDDGKGRAYKRLNITKMLGEKWESAAHVHSLGGISIHAAVAGKLPDGDLRDVRFVPIADIENT